MNRWTGPPDPGKGRGQISRTWPRKMISVDNQSQDATRRPGNQADQWVERYLTFLDREINRLRGGMVARHYRNCAEAHYSQFKTSRLPNDRFRAWAAIRTCAGWLAQLRKGMQ